MARVGMGPILRSGETKGRGLTIPPICAWVRFWQIRNENE
jgi:hypothetical protein